MRMAAACFLRRGLPRRIIMSSNVGHRFQPGNIRPKRRGPSFWYLKLRHSRAGRPFTCIYGLVSNSDLHHRLEPAPTKTASRRRVRTAFSNPCDLPSLTAFRREGTPLFARGFMPGNGPGTRPLQATRFLRIPGPSPPACRTLCCRGTSGYGWASFETIRFE